MNRTVLLVRHPPVADAFRGVCYGSSDVPLSGDGLAGLKAVTDAVQAGGPVTHLYHSGLTRCVALAEEAAALTGLPAVVDARLRERCFGAWELRPWDDIYAETGDGMTGMVTHPGTWRPPCGETTYELRDRVLAWYVELPMVGRIVTVTHGGPIAVLLGTLPGFPVCRWADLVPTCGTAVLLPDG